MKGSEILEFLIPQAEPMQMGFFILILAMFLATVVSTWLNAKPTLWEKNWNNGTADDRSDDLDIDHGSVTDLWHAVATKSERLAEIMPGMLLVVGLLGTFLGLGLALNHASNILGQSDTLNATGAASSMQDLMSMMQGLGTKFKTSTWGIAFFLLLKLWSSWLGYEEKRLTWVIRKVKTELEHRKSQDQETASNKQQALFGEIRNASKQIVEGIRDELKLGFNIQNELQKKNIQILHSGIAQMHKDLEELKVSIAKADNDITECIFSFHTETKKLFETSTNYIRLELFKINENGIKNIDDNLSRIYKATNITSDAMKDFTGSTKDIIEGMREAGSEMAQGAARVGAGAGKVSEAGTSLVSAVDNFSSKFTIVLDGVRSDLSKAINNMSTEAAKTLGQGSKELGEATGKISKALDALSKDVTQTMNGVKNSIEASLKIQEKGAVLFGQSSDVLNENVTTTTGLVQKLGEDIKSGLKAVSDSGRRMEKIGKSVEGVFTFLEEGIVPKISDLTQALEPLKDLHNQQASLLDEVAHLRMQAQQLNRLVDEIQGLRHDLQPQTQLPQVLITMSSQVTDVTRTINETSQKTAHILKVLSSIRTPITAPPIRSQSNSDNGSTS